MDVKATRKERLRELIRREAQAGGEHGAAARVAERAGTSAAYLSQILSTKIRAEVGDRLARQIERAFGLEHGWMDIPPGMIVTRSIESREAFGQPGKSLPPITGSGDLRASDASVRGYGEVLSNVPIIGYAIATPDKDGYFDDMGFPVGGGEGYIPWPTMDPNAYAVRVKGDSMQPRIRPGELIIVEPNRAVSAGDDVVVRCKDGRKMVKQLLIRRDGEVTLGSINQAHRQVTISVAEIDSLQYVTAIVPRSAHVKEGT